MQLTVWTYEGPPHVGAMRVATAMREVHYVLHAPQGDTYADLLFTMIERRNHRPPVTYTTFQARDLGSDTAELFQRSAREAYARFRPQAMLVGSSCTAELIQDDPGGLAKAMKLPIPVIPLELPSYQRKENWGASETFYQLVRTLAGTRSRDDADANTRVARGRPSCNLLGPTALGFRHRDDVREITRLLGALGIEVNVVAPYGATPDDLRRLGQADFNVVLYPEIAAQAAGWMTRNLGLPATRVIPIGYQATREFIQEVAALAAVDPLVTQAVLASAERDGTDAANPSPARAPWYSRSVDSTYLTGKRVFVFGDATHAVAAARVAQTELGFEVVGLGTYSREFAREIREAAKLYGVEPLITDDYLEVEAKVAELQPELVLGTQMERHIAKRLGIPCAVISAPVHVQDFPARYSPQMGFEGANVLFDTWVHPLMMGLEEHLLGMFRGDFEFHDGAAPSHLGRAGGVPFERQDLPADMEADVKPELKPGVAPLPEPSPTLEHGLSTLAPTAAAPAHPTEAATTGSVAAAGGAGLAQAELVAVWAADAESELRKIPFFVRGKARRNTERFALDRGVSTITVETLYDAKAYYSSR